LILIDTNILVYATVPGFDEHDRAQAVLEGIRRGEAKYCITWMNVFEYLRVVTHPKLVRPLPLPLAQAIENVQGLLAQPGISRIDSGPRHLENFEEICLQAAPVTGNFVHDCRLAAIMRDNGVDRILTRDSGFYRIPGIDVINPFL
jgi:toxin-antitoxin system PIN domain toxin